jgi:phospholipid/cholesterol/gamma-HCH transport system ATP-binding protein
MTALSTIPLASRTNAMAVELQNVHLSFGANEILSGIDLVITPRERLVVIGQSGGGKSTLLRLILGILKPSAGSVRFEGREVSRLGRRQLNVMRQKIGMVYQNSALISSLSVRDNLALPLEELTDKSRGEIDHLVAEKLQMVGMIDARDKMPSELSGGMRKRIGLARGIIMDPQLILYDEPSAGLDPVTSSVIDELIIGLSEKISATSIIVTHEMESAFKIATRMAMLFRGKIIAEDSPASFKHPSNPIVAQFISGDVKGPILESSAP